jgi:hypothetical protein
MDATSSIQTQINGKTTESYVNTSINNLIDAAPGALNTLNELAAALGDDVNFSTTVTNSIAKKAPIASPTFTGTVSGITQTMVGLGNVTNESKATMFASPTFTGTTSGITQTMVGLGNVTNESKATMFSSPVFTDNPTAPTQLSGDNTTNIATTAFVQEACNEVTASDVGLGNVTNESKSTMFASPTFTGTT